METTPASTAGLGHIYFFLHNEDAAIRPSASTVGNNTSVAPLSTSDDMPADGKHQQSRSPSPGSLCSSASTISSSSNSAKSQLSASAAEFVPTSGGKPPVNTNTAQLLDLRDIWGKGSGLVATKDIPLGTRIHIEKPLFRIVRNELRLAWEQYSRLGNAEKKVYDGLHFYVRPGLDLGQASRLQLLRSNDLDFDDEEELVADMVRVMGIFSVNNFEIDRGRLAIFATASRLNHSCVPNVHHCYNPSLQQETIHAVRDIRAGEELVTNYLGATCHTLTRAQRWEILRANFGFTCQCEACSDRTGSSDARHELLGTIIWGLEQYLQGAPPLPQQLIPATPWEALEQAKDVVTMLLKDGLFGVELIRAYRLISKVAMSAGDLHAALEYALDEMEVERNIMGPEVDDLKKKGAASEVWVNTVLDSMRDKGFAPTLDHRLKLEHFTRRFWLHKGEEENRKLRKVFKQLKQSRKQHAYHRS